MKFTFMYRIYLSSSMTSSAHGFFFNMFLDLSYQENIFCYKNIFFDKSLSFESFGSGCMDCPSCYWVMRRIPELGPQPISELSPLHILSSALNAFLSTALNAFLSTALNALLSTVMF